MLKLGIHMDNELLYYGIENRTPCTYSSLYLSIFYPVFFVFVFRLLRISVTVFFANYLLLLIYSSALLKQCSGAIVRFSDSSSFSFSPDFSSKISPQPFKIETSNLVYRFTTTSCIVELKMSLLLFVLP